jgi:hypothetical protein
MITIKARLTAQSGGSRAHALPRFAGVTSAAEAGGQVGDPVRPVTVWWYR